MPCIDASGELTEKGRSILAELREPASLEDVALRIDVPLYQIRAAARELEAAGLLKAFDGTYVVVAKPESAKKIG